MNCNEDIHNEINIIGEVICPFCNQDIGEIEKRSSKRDRCCPDINIINDNGMRVCKRCGQVDGYNYVQDYIDFHDNKFKFRRKSVYQRKYHIENIILNAKINIPRIKIEQIFKVFDEIEKIAPLINKNRKRMISINFLIRQILMKYMSDIPFDDIKTTKSEKTLKYYNKYWKKINGLIGDKIENIIQK